MEPQILKHGQTCSICRRLIHRGEAAYRMGPTLNVWVCSGCYDKYGTEDL